MPPPSDEFGHHGECRTHQQEQARAGLRNRGGFRILEEQPVAWCEVRLENVGVLKGRVAVERRGAVERRVAFEHKSEVKSPGVEGHLAEVLRVGERERGCAVEVERAGHGRERVASLRHLHARDLKVSDRGSVRIVRLEVADDIDDRGIGEEAGGKTRIERLGASTPAPGCKNAKELRSAGVRLGSTPKLCARRLCAPRARAKLAKQIDRVSLIKLTSFDNSIFRRRRLVTLPSRAFPEVSPGSVRHDSVDPLPSIPLATRHSPLLSAVTA